MPDAYRQQVMVNALAIRDANAHDPDTDPATISVIDILPYLMTVIHVVNTHNLAIRCQAFGAIGIDSTSLIDAGTTNPATLGTSFDVASNDEEIRLLPWESATPLIYVQTQVVGGVAPTSGSITVRAECSGIKPGMVA